MHHTRAVRAADLMWRPSTAPTGFQVDEPLPINKPEDGCWSLTMKDPAEGSSGVKVTELLGYPGPNRLCKNTKA